MKKKNNVPAVDIVDFMVNGSDLNSICINDPIAKVISLMGKPVEIVGDEKAGFFHYHNGLRYGYFGNEVNELAILFHETGKYSYRTSNQFNEEIIISGVMQLHEFIYMLKSKEIKWECIKGRSISGLTLQINNKTYVLFDLYNGYLDRISISRM